MKNQPKPGFAGTVRLLLRYARRRALARAKRQRELFRQKTKGRGYDWGVLQFPMMILLGLLLHAAFAFTVNRTVSIAHDTQAVAEGKMVLSPWLKGIFERAEKREKSTRPGKNGWIIPETIDDAFKQEASIELQRHGMTRAAYEAKLREQYTKHGPEGFAFATQIFGIRFGDSDSGLSPLQQTVGLFMLCWWFLMITCQGEGVDLDVQRRRNPMWEWQLSHPVQPGAVFLAEMLAPFAANPNIILAPVFWILLLRLSGTSFFNALLPGMAIGFAFAVAAACLFKAIEVSAMLRLAPRNRSAALGLVSWLGFISSIGIFLFVGLPDMAEMITGWLVPVARWFHPPIFGWMVGTLPGEWALTAPVLIACTLSIIIVLASVRISGKATEFGLAGTSENPPRPAKILERRETVRWLGDPLYRKELLWFLRDRGAVVQALLIPMTLAGFQLINLRGVVMKAAGEWHWLCTMAVVFGTYFLFVLGPRSLVSEGAALWIPLTWPRGMESLLKAKARLWAMLANILVGLGLIVSIFLFPAAWWKIALVGAGWWLFSRSLAQKSVTLVQTQSESGEARPVPTGRRMAAWLGTFTFASGIATQQWHLALVGVVYSWMTAAAMWQNFRERLPYLFDPWSEKLPRPPTVMTGMVAILAMTEVVAIISAIALAIPGNPHVAMIQAIGYGVVGLLTWLATRRWLGEREVTDSEIWRWPAPEGARRRSLLEMLPLGVIIGAAMGYVAWLYMGTVESWWPNVADYGTRMAKHFADHPNERIWLGVLVVVCAPLAEEYLFRGLLFRALDREWGGWKAVAGSAAFFAIYHPVVSWPLVGAIGAINACLFKRSGSLWPAVFCHAAYNLVVILR